MKIGDYSVGGAPMGGLDTVSGMRKRYDELVDGIVAGVRDVRSEILADNRQIFSAEGSAVYDNYKD